jgi:GNAT superfamily N-acetyltransferase
LTRVVVREAASRTEEQRSLEIYNAVWPWDAITLAEVDSFRQAVRAYVDSLAYVAGEPVGAAAVAILSARPTVGFLIVTVLEESRGRGAGTALYRFASVWACERSLDEFEAKVPEDDADSLAWAERRGFREIERNSRLVLDLSGLAAPAVAPPEGVEVVTWAERPELARGMYEVACEAYVDIPGSEDDEMKSFDDWLAHDLGGSGDRPEATFVAVAGDEVVGYAKFSLTEAQPKVAFHDMTGVKRAWRGRGVAGALKRAEVAWAIENGYERLQTQNEVRNEPIRRLNERLGYRLAPGLVLLRGPLAPNADS